MSWTPLVGHDEPLARLRRAAAEGRLGHGYLFVGPAGVGKRRFALHVAQGLLCETRPPERLDPCGHCQACVEVAAGTHPDVLTLEKPEDKNVIPVETMKEFCPQLGLRPARGRKRIALVDDADALEAGSANALLKTLEEPPPGTLLVLVGTSAEAQLPTILSRVQVVRFRPLTEEQAARVLLAAGTAGTREEALRLARLGGGCPGQAAELAAPEWQDFRAKLLDGLANPQAPRHLLAREVNAFVEDAGKDGALKRARARRAVGLATELFRDALRRRAGGILLADPVEAARVDAVAAGAETVLLDQLERCVAAEAHIDRFLALPLSLECWLDDLAQIAAGQYVAPVAEGW